MVGTRKKRKRVVRKRTPGQEWAWERFNLMGSLKRIQIRSGQLREQAERVVGSDSDLGAVQACLDRVELNAEIAFNIVRSWVAYSEFKRFRVAERRDEDG